MKIMGKGKMEGKTRRLIKIGIFALIFCGISMSFTRAVYAFDCGDMDIRDDNDSINRACILYGGTARGAMWLSSAKKSDSISKKLNDTVVLDNPDTKKVTVYLYGSVLNRNDSRTYYGSHVYVVNSEITSHQSDSTVSSKSFEPLTLSKHAMYRGVGGNTSKASFSKGWETGGIKATLNIEEFKKVAKATEKKGYTRYTKTVHVYRCFGSYYNGSPGSCYSDPSTIKVDIPTVRSGEFYSKSKVEDPAGEETDYSDKDGGGKEKPTSGKASAGTYKIPETETAATVTVNVKFTHHMVISPASRYSLFSKVSGLSTKWTVTQTMTGQSDSTVGSGTLSPGDFKEGSATYYKNISYTVPVTVTKNKKVKVCQTISYNHKNFKVDESTKKLDGTPSGKNDSEACITISYNGAPDDCTTNPDLCPKACPLSGFDHNENYGNTVASSEVKNYNTTDWRTEVLAKPGDEVQFRHTLCAGAQTVTASWKNGDARKTGFVTTPNWFYLRADASGYGQANNYLFNRTHLASTTTFSRLTNSPAQLTAVNPEEIYKGDTYYWGFRVYSPKNASTGGATSYASNNYNCAFYDGSLAQTFQIPGFGPDIPRDCRSKDLYNSPSSLKEISRSNVGHAISQSLVYNDVKAWVNQGHTEASCSCNTNIPARSWYENYPGGNGYLYQTCKSSGVCSCYFNHQEPRTGTSTSCTTVNGKQSCTTSYYTYYVKVCDGDAPNCTKNDDRVQYYPISVTSNNAQKTATVKVPYNFTTSTEAYINSDDDVVYAGQDTSAYYNVSIDERLNSDVSDDSYLTMTPNDTLVQLMTFTVNSNISYGEIESKLSTSGVTAQGESMQTYLSRTIGSSNGVSNFQVINGYDHGYNGKAINGEGKLEGPVNDPYNHKTYTSTIPDVEPGSKFCVVVGINHADSHGLSGYELGDVPSGQGAGGYSLSGASRAWRVSNAACRTIAKKPNFQVWGGVYSQGRVETSLSPKYTFGGGDHTFGSWSDTIAIGANAIYQFASGSALGYANNGGGSPSKNTSYCDMIKMTVTNNDTFRCSSQRMSGYAGIFSDISDKLDQIISRYTPNALSTTVNSGSPDINSLPSDTLNNGGQYTYINGDAYVNSVIQQTTGTRVIHVNGTLHINRNICTGLGSCTNGDNNLTLGARNSQRYGGIEEIPQILIIADNVVIDAEVTQIDAWIFAQNGTINTCTAGPQNADTCNKTLIFNGPVFASRIELNRTAGAYPGRNEKGSAKATEDLASSGRALNINNEPISGYYGYGSETPAEIFNLRPDTYFWAYNQANRLSQATVVYMRELAPRY